MTRLLRLLAAAGLTVLVVAACSGGGSPSAAGGSTPAGTSAPAATGGSGGSGGGNGGAASGGTITIENFKYGTPLTVAPGTKIEVENKDVARHDVVADDGTSFRTPLLGQGEKTTFTAPSQPGTYKFSCSAHPASMTGIGTLIVRG